MAKTHRNLFPNLIAWENLELAYRRCRRRKRFKPQATAFDFDWECQLLLLQQELSTHSYRPGEYRHFQITDPKPRRISAAPFRDRVVHHAIVNVLEPIFERRFLFDSYACRRGKGTHRAVDRAQQFLRRYPWCLKTDIVRFFPNVDHLVLLDVVERTIRDPHVLRLIRVILKSGEGILKDEATPSYFPGDDLFSVLRPCGLPIGNLTSQFLANVLMDPIDHFVKEQLQVPGYIRYADDLLLFGNSRQQMWDYQEQLALRLQTHRLRLHRHKTHVHPCHSGVRFLGFLVQRHRRRPLQDGLRRFSRRMRRLRWERRHGRIDFQRIRASVRAWLAHLSETDAQPLIRSLLKHRRL